VIGVCHVVVSNDGRHRGSFVVGIVLSGRDDRSYSWAVRLISVLHLRQGAWLGGECSAMTPDEKRPRREHRVPLDGGGRRA
jgi:hypothetical protein